MFAEFREFGSDILKFGVKVDNSRRLARLETDKRCLAFAPASVDIVVAAEADDGRLPILGASPVACFMSILSCFASARLCASAMPPTNDDTLEILWVVLLPAIRCLPLPAIHAKDPS